MMEQKNLAVMMLTHNHVQTVEEVLKQNLRFYRDYEIDVYVCDDGDDGTKDVVDSFIEEGYDNIFWVDAHNAKDGNNKYFLAISQQYTLEKYKYIFPLKDRGCFSEKIISQLAECSNSEYDIIMIVNDFDRWELHFPNIKDEYDDPVEYFGHYGQLTTNWRSIVYRTDSILTKDNLNEFDLKYEVSLSPFVQTITTFAGLASINEPKIKIIRATETGDINEICRFGARSSWRDLVFDLWIDQWSTAIYVLPSVYDGYKAQVVKAETNLEELFGSCDSLLLYKVKGTLTREVFEKYREVWELISDIPADYVDLILLEDYKRLFELIYNELVTSLKNHDYDKAYYLVMRNRWMSNIISDYSKILYVFGRYKAFCTVYGAENVMSGIDSIDDIVKKYDENEKNKNF